MHIETNLPVEIDVEAQLDALAQRYNAAPKHQVDWGLR